MLTIRRTRRWLPLFVIGTVVIGGAFAGAVIAGQFRDRPEPQAEEALRNDPLVQVAEIAAADGLGRRGVFVQQTSAGFLCVWDAPTASSDARMGGCNDAGDPFGGRALLTSLAYDGGPAIADVRDARVIGLADSDVARVVVLMSDGTRRNVVLRPAKVAGGTYQAFGYRFKRTDLRQGIGPAAVLALSENGAEIDRQTTGIGG